VGCKSLLLGVCSCHIFYGQRKVRVVWLVEGLVCPSAIFVRMSRSTAVTVTLYSHFLSAIFVAN